MNAACARHFNTPYPAGTTIGVARRPLGARVEIGLAARRPAPRSAGAAAATAAGSAAGV